MFTAEYIFANHSKGDFEGSKYDNVVFSDGIQTAKFRNDTGRADFSEFKRGESCKVTFTLEFGKTAVKPVLVRVEPL